MSETRERRWGQITVSKDFSVGLLESYLPEGHRVLASRIDPLASFDYHIVEGPDMPVVEHGKYPVFVEMLYYVDESGTEYAYWTHRPENRWLLPIQSLTA